MLTITRIAAEQSEETKQEKNFSKTAGENFEWYGKGAAFAGANVRREQWGAAKDSSCR